MKRAAHSDLPRRVDESGRVWFGDAVAAELLLRGFDLRQLHFEPNAEITTYNRWCRSFDKSEYSIDTSESPEYSASIEWALDEPYASLPVLQTLTARCATEAQRERVRSEMALFESKNLLPLLRAMFMLVDHCRINNVLIGVGRGSSVSSYVLYLIGVHKIDPMEYDLPITDFLKD